MVQFLPIFGKHTHIGPNRLSTPFLASPFQGLADDLKNQPLIRVHELCFSGCNGEHRVVKLREIDITEEIAMLGYDGARFPIWAIVGLYIVAVRRRNGASVSFIH